MIASSSDSMGSPPRDPARNSEHLALFPPIFETPEFGRNPFQEVQVIRRLFLLGILAASGVSGVEPPDIAGQIRPLLAARCLKCHGPDKAARKAGFALHDRRLALDVIVPRDANASELMARVTTKDPGDRMPPPDEGPPLSPTEVAQLRSWIDAGAAFPTHWSFVKPTAPPQRDIDGLVRSKLDEVGLDRAPEADRGTLLRRLHLDLIGLPPTGDDLAAFLADERPDAYDREVDQLLASGSFGEHWAAMWLDLARYADTKGYEKDARRTMWPYRDWVIQAFDQDLPFGEFTVQQLAGDLLPDASPSTRLATGFHRNTMTNDEGGTDDEEFRVAAVVDRVDTTLQVWMGLTAGCAACHDHKFDPLTHREYYSVFDVFNQTADSDRVDDAPLLAVRDDESNRALEQLDRTIAELEPELALLEARQVERFGAWRESWTPSKGSPPVPDVRSFLQKSSTC